MILSAKEKEAKKRAIMEGCFDCYCNRGLSETGMAALGKACGMNHSSFYNYFDSLDQLIVQSTQHCMTQISDELMAKALSYCRSDILPDTDAVIRLLREMPRWAADRYGAKFRLMYQIYSSPKYLADGKAFFENAKKRYADYASHLAEKTGVPLATMLPVVFTFARAVAHYAMFEDEYYLNAQTALLIETVQAAQK